MSLAEKIYLAMIVFMFVAFMVLMATLCWLDGKEDRIQRRRERRPHAETPESLIANKGVAQH